MPKAEFRREGAVGEIVLTDPPLNLVGEELFADLRSAIAQAEEEDVRAVLVWAEGDAFCAGANVDIFLDRSESDARELLEEFMSSIAQAERLPCPTVAAVHGMCLAAGLEIALACDMIWASDDAQLGLVEAVIGATPFGGGTQRLAARAGAGRAAEAVLTGGMYPADRMLEWGVVNRVVPRSELHEKARRFAARLAAGPTLAHRATKEMLQTAVDDGVAAADEALPEVGARVMASDDLQRGARTLLEEGPGKARFEGR
jgi:enoyl-CoA hydratase/carnithine racemase